MSRNADDLGLPRGIKFQGNNPLSNLEATVANESGEAQQGLSDSVRALENIQDRVGEERDVGAASKKAATRSRLDEEQFERATRGMDLSDRQKKSAGRRLGLTRSLARASATGGVRRGFTDRQRVANRAGGSFGDALFGQRIGAETELAAADTAETNASNRANADKKSGILGTIGKVAGMAAMIFLSSEDAKDDLGHESDLLSKLKKVRVNRWNYKGAKREHVGPFAEEFNREFGTGTESPETISVIDALGVTLGAVKELNAKVEARAQ